jgi:hypothetical protein
MNVLRLSGEEPPPILYQKRKQAEVFMVNDITEMLLSREPSDRLDDTDEDSDDSQKSSQSYREGAEIYKTSLLNPIVLTLLRSVEKLLNEAIQRRRDKLQKLKEIGKKVLSLYPTATLTDASWIKRLLRRWSASKWRKRIEPMLIK